MSTQGKPLERQAKDENGGNKSEQVSHIHNVEKIYFTELVQPNH